MGLMKYENLLLGIEVLDREINTDMLLKPE